MQDDGQAQLKDTLAGPLELTRIQGLSDHRLRHARSFYPGETVGGHFELVRPLGAGGMGEVFIARDTKLGRRVALKSLRLPEETSEEQLERFVQLFRRDAASTAQLNHPNIVTIFQFGEHHRRPFFAMELVDGAQLEELLVEQGAFEEHAVLQLGIQLCQGLEYAHNQGIIHRDIKPSNLMRDRDGRLKILDFGVALMRKAQEELMEAFSASRVELEKHLGSEARAAGTLEYMAPEQIRGLLQDARVDVWATGVTLFELLTGQRPYRNVFELNRNFKVVWPEDDTTSELTRQAIESCLVFLASKRTATMAELEGVFASALQKRSLPKISQIVEPKTNLVDPGNAFRGRDDECAQMEDLLLERATRLVTLVGTGGVGKSRLALQWGLYALEDPRVDRVLLCQLAPQRTRDGILMAIGQLFGVSLGEQDPVEKLGRILAGKEGLILILDNCEHLVDELASLISAWGERIRNVRLIVTSRIPLDVEGERVLEVAPLRQMEHALSLYTARAREGSPGWSCPAGEEEALKALVNELDRLPLAIELAASRARLLPPSDMLERMNQRFRLLRSSKRGAPERQTTLRGTIAWSWELLDALGRAVMTQLAVFEGKFTLEAAEEVVDLGGHDTDFFVLDVLELLVRVSLLTCEEGHGRFFMLESIHAFAREQLDASPHLDEVRARHARWFGRWDLEALEFESAMALPRLRLEAEDLRVASIWALRQHDDPALMAAGLACTAALAAVLVFQGPYHAIDELLERARSSPAYDTPIAALALGYLAPVLKRSGDEQGAYPLQEKALEKARQLGELSLEGWNLGQLGYMDCERGALDQAHTRLVRALEIARETNNSRLEVMWLSVLAFLERIQGNTERTRELFQHSIEISRRMGHDGAEAIYTGSLGALERDQGNFELAEQHLSRALDLARRLHDSRGEGVWLGQLGTLAHRQGQEEKAAEFWEKALASSRRIGDRRYEGLWLGNLGKLANTQGQRALGRSRISSALEIARELGDRRGITHWLGHLGMLERGDGNLDQAADFLEEALRVSRELGDHRVEEGWLTELAALERERGDTARAQMLEARAFEISDEVDDMSCASTDDGGDVER